MLQATKLHLNLLSQHLYMWCNFPSGIQSATAFSDFSIVPDWSDFAAWLK